MELEWAFSITDAIVDGLILGLILQYFAQRSAKKDQKRLEQQEKEDAEMLDSKLDELYNKIVEVKETQKEE